MKTKSQKPLLLVARCQPRMAEMNFYSLFRHFRVRVVGAAKAGWVVEKDIPKNIEFVDLPLKPRWGFDPVTRWINPEQYHRSWQDLTGLEKHVREAAVVNISDTFYFSSGQSARLAATYGVKLVTVVWENIPHHPSSYIPPYCFNVWATLRHTDLFIARSQGAVGYLRSLGVDEEQIRQVYKGIDMQQFSPAKRKKQTDHITIVFVGQLVPSKGIEALLQAFERLWKEHPQVKLLLLGRSNGGTVSNQVEVKSRTLPIEMVQDLDYRLVPAMFRGADIYCHLSTNWKYLGILPGGNDWFPYSVLEAMASGLPIVATAVGGIPEQLGQAAGNIYVPERDGEATYRALKELVGDEERRRRIGQANRLRAERMFDMVAQAKRTEKAIMEVL